MFGEITNAKLLDGWTLKLEKADKLPQDLTTAFGNLFGAKFGGSYVPMYYVGTQPVNGTNHKLVVERTKQVSGGKTIKDFVVVTINIPAGDFKAEAATKVSEEDATDFVLRDEIEKGVKKDLQTSPARTTNRFLNSESRSSKAKIITSSAKAKATILTLNLILHELPSTISKTTGRLTRL